MRSIKRNCIECCIKEILILAERNGCDVYIQGSIDFKDFDDAALILLLRWLIKVNL